MSNTNYLVPGELSKQLQLELPSMSDDDYFGLFCSTSLWPAYHSRECFKKERHKQEEENKVKIKEFIEETALDDAEWVKERKEEYLIHELINISLRLIELYSARMDCQDQTYQWFGDFILDERIKPLERQYKKIKQKLYMWQQRVDEITMPKNYFTDEEVEVARAVEISNFIEIIRESGGKGWARCPFGHDDKTPSFCWYQNNNSYYSFCCGKGGDVIRLVMDLEKLDFMGAIEYLLRY